MRTAASCCGILACAICVGAAAAGERDVAHLPPPAWLVFGGVSAGTDYASTYGGAILSPAGSLWEPGLRLRSASAAGFYRTGAPGARRTIPFASSALLAGYQIAAGDHSLSIYAGPETVFLPRSDPPHHRAGWHVGGKALAELHLEIDEHISADGHIAYGSALRRLEAGAKVLSRVAGPWRIGPQAGFFDKADGRDIRVGMALSRRGARSGLGASAGLSFSDGKDAAPFLTIGFDQSF